METNSVIIVEKTRMGIPLVLVYYIFSPRTRPGAQQVRWRRTPHDSESQLIGLFTAATHFPFGPHKAPPNDMVSNQS